MKKPLIACALATAAQFGMVSSTLAHAGHDHNHWSSATVHALAFLAIIAVAGAVIWSFKNVSQKKLAAKKGDL